MRTFFTYLLMVGGPLGGLMLILHYGAGLEAPGAVSGRWLVAETGAEMVVEQSGRYLRGDVEGQTFDAFIEPRGGEQRVWVEAGPCAGLHGLMHEVPDGWAVEFSGSHCLGSEVTSYTLARVE